MTDINWWYALHYGVDICNKNQSYLILDMEKIIADSPSVSQWKERKIGLAKELRKFGIDIENDTAMKVDEATMKSLGTKCCENNRDDLTSY
jgi:hypothetical protein